MAQSNQSDLQDLFFGSSNARPKEETTPADYDAVKTMIQNGWTPLKAWREIAGLTKQQVADAAAIDILAYYRLEAEFDEMTDEDALNLSRLYSVMPYDLIEDAATYMPIPILLASLRRYNDLEPNSYHQQDASEMIGLHALPSRSVDYFHELKQVHLKIPNHNLIVGLLDRLIYLDHIGHLSVPYAWVTDPMEVAHDYIREQEAKRDGFLKNSNAAQISRDAKYKEFCYLGHDLYNRSLNIGCTWKDVSESIKNLRGAYSADEVAEMYLKYPETIGLYEWPDVKKDTFHDKRDCRFLGSWHNARKTHAELLRTYLHAEDDYKWAHGHCNRQSLQVTNLENWVLNNNSLLEAYCIRQIIHAHPDFSGEPIPAREIHSELPKLLPRP